MDLGIDEKWLWGVGSAAAVLIIIGNVYAYLHVQSIPQTNTTYTYIENISQPMPTSSEVTAWDSY